MKKIKFGSLNFDSVEKLSMEEAKKIKGGYGGNDYPTYSCTVRCVPTGCNCGGLTPYTITGSPYPAGIMYYSSHAEGCNACFAAIPCAAGYAAEQLGCAP